MALNASEVVLALAMSKQYILIWEYVKLFFATALQLTKKLWQEFAADVSKLKSL